MHRAPNAEHPVPNGSAPAEHTPSVVLFADHRGSPNPEHLRGLTREVRSGTYHPRLDDVAERVMAWLAPAPRVVH